MRVFLAAVLFLLSPGRALAQAAPDEVPPELRDWIPWVSAELGEQLCTRLAGEARCIWPGELTLELGSSGGSFQQRVLVETRVVHRLPGQAGAWPEDVRVDGKPAPVIEHEGAPAVVLAPGRAAIQGRFVWARMPEVLEVGPVTGVVHLSVNGSDIPLVRREGGQLWLKGLASSEGEASEADDVKLSVFRRIKDGSPMLIETLLSFRVSGRAREIFLPQPNLQGTVALSASGDLALSLERSGALRVQLVPGRHELSLMARRPAGDGALLRPPVSDPWPPEEVWTWQPDTLLRVVELSGSSGVDPSRTDLPAAWKTDAAFLVEANQGLTFKTTRRGEEQVAPSRVDIVREFWLDEAAQAFTVRDHLRGTMNQGFRLDLLSGTLGQVRVSDQDQVITKSPVFPASGVEVRQASLSVEAVSRVPRQGDLAAVGWSEDANSLAATLHLPPGWDVLWATGVDEMPQTWLSRWNLFAVFFLLLLSAAMFRLSGPVGGTVAFAALLLTHGERGAPTYVWLVLVVLSVLHAVISHARARRAARIAFWVVGLGVVVQLVAFSVEQVRHAIYPHLDGTYSEMSPLLASKSASMESASPVPPAEPQAELDAMQDKEAGEGRFTPGRRGAGLDPSYPAALDSSSGNVVKVKPGSKAWLSRQVPADAVVQTGPGIPDTVARSFSLGWSGPVVKDHRMKLVLLPPSMMRVLTALRLLALGLLAYYLWRSLDRPRILPPGVSGWRPATTSPRRNRRRAAAAAMLLFCSMGQEGAALASEPSDERLAELRTRLLRPPACGESCLSVPRMTVGGDADRVRFSIAVHAASPVAYRLPGPAHALGQVSISVDGKPAADLRLEPDGALYLRLDAGVHEVTIDALLPSDRTTIEVGTPPQRVEVKALGWSVSGVGDDGRVQGGALVFQRDPRVGAGEPKGEERADAHVSVLPYFSVVRRFQLGMAGQVTTTVTRVSDPSSPEVLRLPLLPGERVTTPGLDTQSGVLLLTFGREATVVEFESALTLPKAEQPLEIQLEMKDGAAHSEIWSIECAVVWHCTFEGLVPVRRVEDGLARSVYHPWPGEQLKIAASWPKPSAGQSLTVERAALDLTPGTRLGRGQLTIGLRTSQSVLHPIDLPPGARLEEVLVDGTPQSARADGRRVVVSLAPGAHEIIVRYHEPNGLRAWFRSPPVSAGAPGVNYRVSVTLPAERWLLMAGGPGQGPAILLWGYLVLIALGALLLPRLPLSPLGTRDWFLLGLGLTQVPAAAAVLVAGWFFAIASRSRWAHAKSALKDLGQVMLLVYTLGFLMTLTVAVYQGLVSSPDMEVQGAGSSAGHLVWYLDRSPGPLPRVWVLSVSIWVWRGVMLVWSLWLARSLLGWLRFAWTASLEGGFWAPRRPKYRGAAPVPPVGEEGAPGGPGGAPGSRRPPPVSRAPVASEEGEAVPDLGTVDPERPSVPELIQEPSPQDSVAPTPPESDDHK